VAGLAAPELVFGPDARTGSPAVRDALAVVVPGRRARPVDRRGAFQETWRESQPAPAPAGTDFVQDNASLSSAGVVRGLHAQWPSAQGKLLTVLSGRVWDVAVDIRRGSPAFGCWVAAELDAERGDQLWIPAGFAHGFQALTDGALLVYKVTALWAPGTELAVRWDDPALAIPWPIGDAIVSDRDAAAPPLAGIAPDRLPPHAMLPPSP
jgi:dTDP-4-dehydrorhamnose 3,5-epimerase